MFRSPDRTTTAPPTRRRTPRPSGVVLGALVGLLALLVVATACGKEGDAIVFDGPLTTTTRIDASGAPTTEAAAPRPKLGPWVDVTGNLTGTRSECGNVSHVAGRPGTNLVIAGIALQGLWITTSGSDQWTRLDAASPVQITNRTVSLVFDPANSDQFWESGSYGAPGVVHTTDGGRTFQAFPQTVNHAEGMSIGFAGSGQGTMLVGTHERQDLFRSTDGGGNWAAVGPDLADGEFAHYPLVVDGGTYLLGTNGQGEGGIHRTTDGGATWTEVGTTSVGGPGLRASDGSIYWPLANGSLVKSIDGGATFERLLPGGTLATVSNVVEASDGRLFVLGSRSVLTSDDRGENWRSVGPPVPISDAKGVAFSEGGNAVYVWTWDCGDVVPARSIQRLDLTPA